MSIKLRKKEFKCFISGAKMVHDMATANLVCSECNTAHEIALDDFKKKKFRYRLTKTKLFFAILVTLYIFYFFMRRLMYFS